MRKKKRRDVSLLAVERSSQHAIHMAFPLAACLFLGCGTQEQGSDLDVSSAEYCQYVTRTLSASLENRNNSGGVINFALQRQYPRLIRRTSAGEPEERMPDKLVAADSPASMQIALHCQSYEGGQASADVPDTNARDRAKTKKEGVQ